MTEEELQAMQHHETGGCRDCAYIGSARIVYTHIMTVYLVIFPPGTPRIHCAYTVLANPMHMNTIDKG